MTPDTETFWAASGLTARQAHTQALITRCRNCGAWMVTTTRHGGHRPATCIHLTPNAARKAS